MRIAGSAALWDVATGRQLATLRGSFLALFSVGFSRDGSRLLAGAGDGRVVLWDVDTRSEVLTLKGNNYGIIRAVLPVDENTLLSCGSSEVLVWNVPPFGVCDAVPGSEGGAGGGKEDETPTL